MKVRRRAIITFAVVLVVSLSVAGTAFAAGNGKMAGKGTASATVQQAVQTQNGAPDTPCATCEQTRTQNQARDGACDGTCDGTGGGTGDQQRLGNGNGTQQHLRDSSCE